MITERERSLMLTGFYAGISYSQDGTIDGAGEGFNKWLDEVIADNGSTVEQYLDHEYKQEQIVEEKLKEWEATIKSLLADNKEQMKIITVLKAAGLVTEDQLDAAVTLCKKRNKTAEVKNE